jgi:hypothetical protein
VGQIALRPDEVVQVIDCGWQQFAPFNAVKHADHSDQLGPVDYLSDRGVTFAAFTEKLGGNFDSVLKQIAAASSRPTDLEWAGSRMKPPRMTEMRPLGNNETSVRIDPCPRALFSKILRHHHHSNVRGYPLAR